MQPVLPALRRGRRAAVVPTPGRHRRYEPLVWGAVRDVRPAPAGAVASTAVQRTGARTSMSVNSPAPAAHPAGTPEFPRHVVTAVLVAHDGARWLRKALDGLL